MKNSLFVFLLLVGCVMGCLATHAQVTYTATFNTNSLSIQTVSASDYVYAVRCGSLSHTGKLVITK